MNLAANLVRPLVSGRRPGRHDEGVDEALRAAARSRWRGSGHTVRSGVRLCRPEWGREDHDHSDAVGPDQAHERDGDGVGAAADRPASYLDRVGALIESPAFYPNLSGRANLAALARLGRIDTARVDTVLGRVGLAGRAADLYRSYSLGMKQRLGIAASLLVEPTLLILDEPANGLDPAGIVEIRHLMRSLADDGITVIVSSHLLAEIEQVCDFFVMIQAGRLVFQGTVETLFAAQSAELLARPENPADLDPLIAAVRAAGHPARLVEGTVVVDAEPAWAAELNRLATRSGVTLVHLSERPRSLEAAFFELTGEASGDAMSPVGQASRP